MAEQVNEKNGAWKKSRVEKEFAVTAGGKEQTHFIDQHA